MVWSMVELNKGNLETSFFFSLCSLDLSLEVVRSSPKVSVSLYLALL